MSESLTNNKHSNRQIKIGAIMSYGIIGVEIVISLVFTPWMIGVIGKGSYAVYTIVYSLISLFLFDFGISISATKFLSKYRADNQPEMVNKLLSMFFKIYFVIDILVFSALFVIYFFIENIYSGLSPSAISSLKICFIIVGVYSLISFPFVNLDSLFVSHEKFVPLKACTLFQKVITVVLMVVFLLLGFDVVTLILINAIVGFATVIVKLILSYKCCNFHFHFKYFDKKLLTPIILFSIWVAIIALRDKLINGLTPTILGSVSTEEEVAFYGYGLTIITYAYTFATAIGGLFVYRITELLKSKNGKEKLYSLMVKIGKIQLMIISLIFTGFIVFGKPFLVLFIGPDYSQSYLVSILLLIPFVFSVTKQIALTSSYVTDNVKFIAIFNLSTAVVCVCASIFVGKQYGALGVAACYCASCLICELLCDIFVYYKRMKINMFKFYWQTIARIIIPAALLTIGGVILLKYIAIDSKWKLLIGVIAFSLVYLAICLLFLFTKKDIRAILNKPQNKIFKQKLINCEKKQINIVWVTQQADQSLIPICDSLFENPDCSLSVVLLESGNMNDKYRVSYDRGYIYSDSKDSLEKIDEILSKADVIIIGQAKMSKIKKYLKKGTLVFRVSEPLYKNGRGLIRLPLDYIRYIFRHKIYQRYNVLYLAIGNDCFRDLTRFDDFYEGRSYVWGYYPLSKARVSSSISKKPGNELSILWSGKLIELKHPEYAVMAASYFKENNINAKVDIFGNGPEEEHVRNLIIAKNVEPLVALHEPIDHDSLLKKMKESDIYLFSSDSREGWGMVLNEAMSNGCACIANKQAGASNILIDHKVNGLLYTSEKDFYDCLNYAIDTEQRKALSEYANETYLSLYVTEALSDRLIKLIKNIQTGKFESPFEHGPCSNCETLFGK